MNHVLVSLASPFYDLCVFNSVGSLIIIIINDIYNSSEKLSFYLFADDTKLLYDDKDLKSLKSAVNIELQNVCNWLKANRLTVNAKKSNLFRHF